MEKREERKKKITGNKTDRLLFREYIYIYISGLEILAGLALFTRARKHTRTEMCFFDVSPVVFRVGVSNFTLPSFLFFFRIFCTVWFSCFLLCKTARVFNSLSGIARVVLFE